mmetsp:Transcript_50473/g.156217  ORF Transcript_50473/g.156217 Transcript_50473/m.156217 type:complete len:499 (+) Transcript_50473:122-1618(+)
MSEEKDRRSKMATSTVNAPAKKGGAGGSYTWGKAEDVTDFEPVGVSGAEKVSVAPAAAPAEAAPAAAEPMTLDRNDSAHFPKLSAAAKETSQEEEARKAKERESVANALSIANGLFMAAVTMVVPTRAPMVLAIKNGDAPGTARTMGLMSSCAAVIELFVNPIFGRLSDKYGRKPFLLLAPVIDAALHLLVAAFPRALRVTFVDRMITGSMIFCFVAPVNAAMSDLFGTGQKLAESLARAGTFFGVGCALGPFVGAKLGGARSFLASALTFLATGIWLACKFPETLTDDRKKEFNLAACSPLRFLKLFQGKMTSRLAATIGLQSFGDYVNIYDINFLYMKTVLGYGQAEVGNFATAVGVTQIVNGELMRRMIRGVGQKTATLASNLVWILAMALLGTSRSAAQLAMSLGAMACGHQRAVAVGAFLQKHGQAAGMGAAEVQGAQANLTAVLKVAVPIVYGNIFAWATSNGRKLPGLPYFLIGLLTAVGQLTFSSVDPEK